MTGKCLSLISSISSKFILDCSNFFSNSRYLFNIKTGNFQLNVKKGSSRRWID